MSLFKRRPQFARVEYESPANAEVLHAYASDDIPLVEQAAKRRRIEAHAKDYLKGRDLFLASVTLRGPFGDGWENPWREKTHGKCAHDEQKVNEQGRGTPRHADLVHNLPPVNTAIPESDARHTSKAGSNYCHDWLQRQKGERYTPNLDDEFDTEIRDGDTITPSKPTRHKRAHSAGSDRISKRAAVVPVRTLTRPHKMFMRSDLPEQNSKFNSLQVNIGSATAKRSVSEQPARDLYRGTLAMHDPIIDDSDYTKVSLIRDDKPQKRRVSQLQVRSPRINGTESPGFPFRRVADGRRPTSRGSNNSAASTTQPNDQPDQPHDTRIRVPMNKDQPTEDNQANDQDLSEEETDIHMNDDGKWPCPAAICPKRPKPYATTRGIRAHLNQKHGIWHIKTHYKKMQSAGPQGGAPKLKRSSKKAATDVLNATSVMTMDADQTKDPELKLPERTAGLVVDAQVPIIAEVATVEGLVLEGRDHSISSTVTLTAAAHHVTEQIQHTGKARSEEAVAQVDAANAPEVTDKDDHPVVLNGEPDACKDYEATNEANALLNVSNVGQDRQDSRAYSTFTFNPEMSTQTALLLAHQAFQDTQSPEKAYAQEAAVAAQDHLHKQGPSVVPAAVASTENVTPFRRPGIPSFFSRGAPDSHSRAAPASTQDLMNAAAALTFSTVKKPAAAAPTDVGTAAKKRISFADWPQAKPSQPQRPATVSLKQLEWSSFAETPQPANQHDKTMETHSQPLPEEDTPTPTPAPPSASAPPHKQSSLPFQPKQSSGNSGLLPSAPSEIPVLPSYQEAQQEEFGSAEIEQALDEAVSFLSTWDVDREISRCSNGNGGEGVTS